MAKITYLTKTDLVTTGIPDQNKVSALDLNQIKNTVNTNDDILTAEITNRESADTALQNNIDTKAPINNPTFTGTVGGVTKAMVGLPNVDNTSDANKPVSTATQTALNAEATARQNADDDLQLEVNKKVNYLDYAEASDIETEIWRFALGISEVDNTSDADKQISTAQASKNTQIQNAIDAEATARAQALSDKVNNTNFEEADGIGVSFWKNKLNIQNVNDTVIAGILNQMLITQNAIKACKTVTQLAFYIRGAQDNCTIESIKCVQEF